MKIYVGITDTNWFNYLSSQKDIDEINFWQPSGGRNFKALNPGEIFVFRLHSPNDYVVGYGIYSYFSILPIDKAWEYFGIKNGASSLEELRTKVEKFRKIQPQPFENYEIGCIMIKQPTFLKKENWFKIPSWKTGIQQGKTYDLSMEDGKYIFNKLNMNLTTEVRELPTERYGEPIQVFPRLGQGTFRSMVLDSYNRRCAITGEKILPILHSAHIKPYNEGGEHSINNGILLREDIHTLFDRGYVTISTDYHFEVSNRIKTDFNNGKNYYSLHGTKILLPNKQEQHPDKEILSWHNNKLRK